jgi:hypothetical protein
VSTITAALRQVIDAQRPPSHSGNAHRAEAPDVQPVLVRLADVQPEAISWLWPGRLAVGKLSLLAGDPGLGKSWISLDVAARLSASQSWPDGAAAVAPADVVLMSAEDGLTDTIRPRLDALGADVRRIHHLAVLRAIAGDAERERAIGLSDTTAIERAIGDVNARLLIIDPISAYLGDTDSHRDAEVRGLLAPLAAVAERTGAAVLGVMHLTKGGQRPAIYRAAGSIAFSAAARIVLAVAADPDDDTRRILAPIKSNLSIPPAALAYTLADGRLTWDADPVLGVDVNALLAGPPVGRDREEQTDAEAVIRDLLDEENAWPMAAKDAIAAGQAHGIPDRTMRWTAKRLGIRIARSGFGAAGRWLWHRPASIPASLPAREVNTEDVAAIAAMPVRSEIEANNNKEAIKTSHRARASEDGNERF